MDDQRFDPRSNSIGFIRLMLAVAVIYCHCVLIGAEGFEPVMRLSGGVYTLGSLSVDGFFCLSGYLIASSYIRLKSFPVFVWHRVLRIFPALWVCLALTAFGLPLLFNASPDTGYFWRNALEPALSMFRPFVKYFVGLDPNTGGAPPGLAGMAIGQRSIAGVFQENTQVDTVNGSLWTLAFEFRLYMAIGFLGLFRMLRKWVVVAVVVLSWAWFVYLMEKHGEPHTAAIPRTTVHFFMGTLFYFFNPPVRSSVAVGLALLAGAGMYFGFFPAVAPLATTYLMFWLARVLPLRFVGKNHDYSYGVYIYAYPVQQTLTAWQYNRFGIWPLFFMTLGITMVFSVASWHLVERPALRLKNLFQRRMRQSD